MIPGPDCVVACPHCRGLARHLTLVSGNTFGSRVWTDGKQFAPMLPHPPAVARCAHCQRFYWLRDAVPLGCIDGMGTNPTPTERRWAESPDVREPEEAEYYDAIASGFARDGEEERVVRILAWWRRNDAFRDPPVRRDLPPTLAGDAWRSSLDALAALLDERDERARVTKAEVLRELGRFDEALALLGGATSAGYASVVAQLRELCERGDSRVQELRKR